jgi:hypothetical protein
LADSYIPSPSPTTSPICPTSLNTFFFGTPPSSPHRVHGLADSYIPLPPYTPSSTNPLSTHHPYPSTTCKLLPPLSPLLTLSLYVHPLHSLIPYPPILSHISIYGGGVHPPHSFTLPPHLPHSRSHYLHLSSLTSVIHIFPFPINYSQFSSGLRTLTTVTPLFTSLPNSSTLSCRLETHLLNFCHLHISPSHHLTSHIHSHT